MSARVRHSVFSASRPWLLAGAAWLAAVGCGSKTGLIAPDLDVQGGNEGGADVVVATDTQTPPDVSICVEPPQDGGIPLLSVNVETRAQVTVADVLFLIDRTGSMSEEIENIRTTLRTTIVPGLVRAIPDLRLGVATFADFPVAPYGAAEDLPYAVDRAMTADFSALQAVLGSIHVGSGGDNPEAMVEALYQSATGAGGPYIPASTGCTNLGVGYVCFRQRAQPVIVVVSDAPSHNGFSGEYAYDPLDFAPMRPPHTYANAIDALVNQLHARVIGINSGFPPVDAEPVLDRLARDTGTLGSDGSPLVFNIMSDGQGLGDRVVSGVQRFTSETRFNASARVLDLDGSGMADLIRAVRPTRATPMSQVDRFDDMTFYNVVPGTRLTFALEFDLSRVMQTMTEQRGTIRVEYLGDGRPTLGFQDVEVVIPALGGLQCPVQ